MYDTIVILKNFLHEPVGSSGAPPVGQKLPSPKSNKNLLADCELFVKVTCVPPPSKSKVVTSATKLGTGNGVVTTTFAVCIGSHLQDTLHHYYKHF